MKTRRRAILASLGFGAQVASESAHAASIPEAYNILSFGADPTGRRDSTPAFYAAQAASAAAGNPPVAVPAGRYAIHEFAWNASTSFVGSEVGYTQLNYNGSGDRPGTYVIGVSSAGDVPYAGFYNLTVEGGAAKAPWNIIKWTGGSGLDWGFKLENVQFAHCIENALEFDGAIIVNLFINRARFDGVGGFALSISGGRGGSGHPVVLREFTIDNYIFGAFAAAMSRSGFYDGTHWGRGILTVRDGANYHIDIEQARTEWNLPLLPVSGKSTGGAYALIYSRNTIGGQHCYVRAANISGNGPARQSIVLCYDDTGSTNFTWRDIQFSGGISAIFVDRTNPARTAGYGLQRSGTDFAHSGFGVGTVINSHLIEFRDSPPGGGTYVAYKLGDLIFNSSPAVGKPRGWVCTYPPSGKWAYPSPILIVANAAVSAGNTKVALPRGTAIEGFSVNQAIVLSGAGSDGADLLTAVTAIDNSPASPSILISATPSSTVPSCQIRSDTAVFTSMGTL